MKIKIGDTVKVTAGKEAGKTGQVKRVLPQKHKVVLENLNLYKRHLRPRQTGGPGKIVEKERPLPMSSVALICPHCKKFTRVSYLVDKTGTKVRQCRKCKANIK